MRFSVEEIAEIKRLAASGYSAIGIAAALGRDALAVRHKCSAMGLRLRPRKIKGVHDIRVGQDVFALLKDAAARRGVTVQRLAAQLLSAAAIDGIIGAIIDDDHARQEKLARSAVYRETYRKRRRNGEPVLGPREAALLGFQTALARSGLLPPPAPAPKQRELVIRLTSPPRPPVILFAGVGSRSLSGTMRLPTDQRPMARV